MTHADVEKVGDIIDRMARYRRWADPRLAAILEQPRLSAKESLNVRLALLAVDSDQVNPLFERLLKAQPNELLVIRKALQGQLATIKERLWVILQDTDRPASIRSRREP